VAVLLLSAAVAFFWLRSTDIFDVKVIAATGTERITKAQVADITSEIVGESLLSISTEATKEALLALPYVESAEVHRGFPNTLEIEVVECKPVARLQTEEGETWLVSDGGKVLEGADPTGLQELPLLALEGSPSIAPGERLPAVVADVLPLAVAVQADDMRTRLPGLQEIAISAAGYSALVLAEGGEVRLGSADGLVQKLALAVDIVQQCLADGKVIEYIDASVAGRIAVKAK
jgi:cell division protein FtsQ